MNFVDYFYRTIRTGSITLYFRIWHNELTLSSVSVTGIYFETSPTNNFTQTHYCSQAHNPFVYLYLKHIFVFFYY